MPAAVGTERGACRRGWRLYRHREGIPASCRQRRGRPRLPSRPSPDRRILWNGTLTEIVSSVEECSLPSVSRSNLPLREPRAVLRSLVGLAMAVPAMAVRWRRRAARPTPIASASHDDADDHSGFAWKRSSGGGAPWNAPGQPQPRGGSGDSRLCGDHCDELQIVRAAVGGGTSRLGADVCPRSGVFGGNSR